MAIEHTETTEHVVPKRVYYTIFVILMVMTYTTVQVAYFDLGRFNAVAALLIAFFKASLVVLFFMHVKYAPKLIKLFVLGGLFWLAIMLGITMTDYMTRTPQEFPMSRVNTVQPLPAAHVPTALLG
ncbi:MAG TPA: cytochrome C oxidase subunit IV family protein [Vicinamibacterales bacterium]